MKPWRASPEPAEISQGQVGVYANPSEWIASRKTASFLRRAWETFNDASGAQPRHSVQFQLQNDGIRVMDIMPLFVQTGMVTGLDTRSVDRLGTRLTAEDLAKVIWTAATYQGRFGKVHWPVGFMATWLFRLASLGPDRLSRFIARWIAT